MTIYLAICDNNAADRKHLERLLEREKDTRLKNDYDVMYIDSFGSEEALMKTPIKYDMFFIDITDGEHNGMEIAKFLRQKDITAPIVLCRSTISYSDYVNTPKELIFLDKPLNAGQISHLTDVALENARTKLPLIELRCQSETHFVSHKELVRAVRKEPFLTEISLSDGSFLQMHDSIESLCVQLKHFDCFILCNKDIVNILHIDDYADNAFRLSNGDVVTYKRSQRGTIIRAMAHYMKKLRDK